MTWEPVAGPSAAADAAVQERVSVVIATRDRPADLRRCLETVAGLDYPCWEVVVVDQSDGPLTRTVIAQFAGALPGLRHLPVTERGLSRARNVGLQAARGDIVAFLDDDCTVGADWLWFVAGAFARHPEAGLLFGTVRDALLDDGTYVPSHHVTTERELAGVRSAARARGIGAGMYLRRRVADRVGQFDVRLGSGASFLSSEDWDYTFRALRSGATVVETPTVVVDHHGGRPYAGGQAARLLRGNAYSHGALHVKLLRCGQPGALLLIAAELWEHLRLLRPLAGLAGGPSNAGRPVSYARGLLAGLRAPVDRDGMVFREGRAPR